MPEVADFLEYASKNEGKYPGEVSGFHRFDKLTCGFQPGKIYDIAGRPGYGKSSLVACMAIGFARRGVKVGFISLEMLSTEIIGRMVSCESRVPMVKFLRATVTDEEVQRAGLMMQQISALPIIITDQLRTLSEIIMAMHEQAAQGVRVLIVDYLQKIIIPKFRSNRNELVTEISGAMKEMAISLKLPVICCAQLNRESEKQDREPTMADLRDSGSIEQDADFIGLLHAKGKGPDPEYDGGEQIDLIIVKNRSGETGRLTMSFRKDIFRFDEII
jgi:replicative DNA helicase